MSYTPKHTKAEYYDLIKSERVKFCQEMEDGLLQHFSVVSQHVKGETWEDCLDQIWDAVERRKERIKYYKTLPTLKELVYSNQEIDPSKVYEYREKSYAEDSCGGYSGYLIIRMRKVGINEGQREMEETFWKDIFTKNE